MVNSHVVVDRLIAYLITIVPQDLLLELSSDMMDGGDRQCQFSLFVNLKHRYF